MECSVTAGTEFINPHIVNPEFYANANTGVLEDFSTGDYPDSMRSGKLGKTYFTSTNRVKSSPQESDVNAS